MRCPACDADRLEVFFERPPAPILCNVLWPTRDEALAAPMGEIRLGHCPACGMIYNTAFDTAAMVYDQAYENSLHFSPRFQAYAEELATRLIEAHDLRGKHVIDIGCGKGDFLKLICAAGDNRGTGFDASYEGPETSEDGRVSFVRDFYSRRHGHLAADLISCRHVLEHIATPVEFLGDLRRAAGENPRAAIFFEVPHALFTLRDLGIWDIIYEHCSYFAAPALRRLFARCGFDPRATYATFGDQFLCLEAGLEPGGSAGESDTEELAALQGWVQRFATHFRDKVGHWNDRLGTVLAAGDRVAIWGAGSKGVTFLNTVQGGDRVRCAVDINTRKQGRYVPGSGQEVVAPESLRTLDVNRVLVMNPLYRDEIGRTLVELGCEAEIEVV